MTAKTILNMFEEYRKARITFVQTVADLALRSQNVEVLKSVRALELLRPLLNDCCLQIQQCAAVAVGRLAHHDASIGQEIVQSDILTLLLKNIEQHNKYYKKSAMFVLRSICKHNAAIAESVITSGGLEAIMICLADYDSDVKEAATWATGYVARHNDTLARSIVDCGAIPHLILCLQEPELNVKRVAASALADIAKHGSDLANQVSDAGAVPYLSKAATNRDDKLKRQALIALSSIARHSVNLSETVVQADIFPGVLISMGHSCHLVRRNAAMLIRDIVKHSIELAQLVTNMGGVGALVQALHDDSLDVQIPAATAIGFISGHTSQLANCVVSCDGVTALSEILNCKENENNNEILCITVWALGQIGRYLPASVANVDGILMRMLYLYEKTGLSSPEMTRISLVEKNSEAELRARCKTALRQCVQGCEVLSAIEPLLHSSVPPDILKYVLGQFAKILPTEPRSRRLFVISGGLKKVQEMTVEPGTTTMEYITIINNCFPEEIVRYYTPGYPDSLLEKVEQFVPNVELADDELDNKGPAPSARNSQDLLDYMQHLEDK